MKSSNKAPNEYLKRRGHSKVLNFTFDGKKMQGYEGETLAAALLANGVTIVGRSFKLHRPRGIMGCGTEETNAFVQLESGGFAEPNVRATLQPLYEGLRATSQNAWPNAKYDIFGVIKYFQSVLPASFYYKSMMWPNWHFYERFVRPIAGLGKAPIVPDAQNYQKRNLHCDVLIVGGGPTGLAAAQLATRSGLRVVLIDDKEDLGGTLQGQSHEINYAPASEWVNSIVAELTNSANIRILTRTTVSGYYEQNFLVAAERVSNHLGPQAQPGSLRERLWRIRAQRVILATGALERPIVFPDNDVPGIMLASAVRFYLNRFGILTGKKIALLTNNDSAYQTAFDLHQAGVRDITLIDTRQTIDEILLRQVKQKGIRLFKGYSIAAVGGTRKIEGIKIAVHKGEGYIGTLQTYLSCDLLAISGGWTPTIHLFSQAGGTLRYDANKACLVPDSCQQSVTVAGAANGVFQLSECIKAGFKSALEALNNFHTNSLTVIPHTVTSAETPYRITPYWYTQNTRTDKQWLDYQYDVKVSDIELAIRENFVSVEHVKRYTTGGMSIDQGKTSNFNILAVMAELLEKKIPDVGTTRFRPPFQPVTLGTFAGATTGECYAPRRTLPTRDWHIKHGAHFGDYGWQRPEYYPQSGEDVARATRREVLAVRNNVGMFDGSPLGKIELKGPDAALFLNRMYVNNLATLKPGAARYALLTNENGVLIDDGVIVRLSADHFLVHATSASVERVFLMMEELLQCEWPDLKVHVTNVTTQWVNITLSGPNSRNVIQQLQSDIDFSPDKFAHMQFRQGTLEGVACRVLRASFTGEVTFEISVPARYANSLWEVFTEAGQPFSITPYGIEALEVMRIEKGYLHIGSDTDGMSNPLDIGWGNAISRKDNDFIGRRSMQRPADSQVGRLQYVGLEALDPQQLLKVGGHLISDANAALPIKSEGYVTSSCISPMLGKSIGMGLLTNGMDRKGEIVQVYAKGKPIAAKVVPPAHFDSKGERLHG